MSPDKLQSILVRVASLARAVALAAVLQPLGRCVGPNLLELLNEHLSFLVQIAHRNNQQLLRFVARFLGTLNLKLQAEDERKQVCVFFLQAADRCMIVQDSPSLVPLADSTQPLRHFRGEGRSSSLTVESGRPLRALVSAPARSVQLR